MIKETIQAVEDAEAKASELVAQASDCLLYTSLGTDVNLDMNIQEMKGAYVLDDNDYICLLYTSGCGDLLRKKDITYMIFDTHAHYDDEAFDGDREELLSGLAAGGIGTVVNVGADMASTKTTIALTEKYPFIYGAAGVHPSSTAELDEEKFAELRVLAQSGKIVAIGEIGLDYYWEEPDHETQKKWFHRQLNLARELKLPVIIHSRDAAKDTLDIMKEEHSGEIDVYKRQSLKSADAYREIPLFFSYTCNFSVISHV